MRNFARFLRRKIGPFGPSMIMVGIMFIVIFLNFFIGDNMIPPPVGASIQGSLVLVQLFFLYIIIAYGDELFH